MTFEAMWRELAPVGRSASSGGYFRQPYGSAERELVAWFEEAALARGLRLERDGFGNLKAVWDAPGSGDGAVLTGSHLDSVLDGGAFDGPLGVVTALAAVDVLQERGFAPARSIAVAVFVEEEGSRFGLPCLGSRLATGSAQPLLLKALSDRDDVPILDAMEQAGLDPGVGSAILQGVGCFVELHVEQGRDLVDRGAAVGVASGIWPHGRYRYDFAGEANHAGTTRMEDRRDPMRTFARTATAAVDEARRSGQRATFGRVEADPNSTNAIPSRVAAWLDARGATDADLARLVGTVTASATGFAAEDGTTVEVSPESVSGGVVFDPDLARRLAAPRGWPVIPTQAGHDAGILQAAGIPTAMLFVRNPSGVSHSPAEHAQISDCLAGVGALADVLQEPAG